jgi:hypothetical protein
LAIAGRAGGFAAFVQGGLFALLVVACIWGLALGTSLRRHLREHHPKVYARFGYPKSKPSGWRLFDWPSSKEEAQVTTADWDYVWTIFRGELNRIQDERLNALLRRRRAVMWVAAVLMVMCIVTMAFA